MTDTSPTDLLWRSFLRELTLERFASPSERLRDEAAATARRRRDLHEATEPTSLRLIHDAEEKSA